MLNRRRPAAADTGGASDSTFGVSPAPEWMRHAACSSNPNWFAAEAVVDEVTLTRICADCPVTHECLKYALTTISVPELALCPTVWGGLTAHEVYSVALRQSRQRRADRRSGDETDE